MTDVVNTETPVITERSVLAMNSEPDLHRQREHNTGIRGSQKRVQQPRVSKPSQRFNTHRNTGESQNRDKIVHKYRERAEPTTHKKHLRSNSDRRGEKQQTADGQNMPHSSFSTRITKMWRCFVNQAASSHTQKHIKTNSEMLLNVVGCLLIDVLLVPATFVHELACLPTSRR